MIKALKYIGYWLWSLTWGGIMTWIGVVIAFFLLITGHKPHRLGPNIYFEVGNYWGGLELGAFFLTDTHSSFSIKYHEAGHGLQNLIWGPLMPFVICIPSAIRYWYFEFRERAGKKNKPYDSIWFEGQATRWGTNVYGGKK